MLGKRKSGQNYLDQRPGYANSEEFGKIWEEEYAFFETMVE